MELKRTFVRGVKSDTQPSPKDKKEKFKNRITKFQSNLYEKCKMVLMFVLFALVWNSIPVTASVTDNLRSTAAGILGAVDASVGSSYESASTNAKINHLESELKELQDLIADLKTVIETADIK